jgi:predicted aminopeptidase
LIRLKGNAGRTLPGLLCGLAFLALTAILPAGCSMSYLMHAAAGQIRIMHRAVPVERALEDPALGPLERERLLLVTKIKEFGESELGLAPTNNYETVYLGRRSSPVYTVTAAEKTRLELVTWWFPVVGRMPYLGYFDPEAAQKKRMKLEDKGYDVVVWPAEAYSTLGWFQDPVHRNLLARGPVDLAETILHEMTHATLYVKGQPVFNETLANVIGKRGALAFVEAEFGSGSREAAGARALLRDQRLFSRFIDDLVSRLTSVYDSPASDEEKLALREEIFQEAEAGFAELSGRMETDQFTGFGSRGLNNAYILALSIYHSHYNLFEAVLDAGGGSISGSMEAFRELGRGDKDPVLRAKERFS